LAGVMFDPIYKAFRLRSAEDERCRGVRETKS
jgi:hypothetical protein